MVLIRSWFRAAPGFRRGIPKQVRRRPTGIGNSKVDTPEVRFHGRDEVRNLLGISHIQRPAEHFRPCGFLGARGGIFKLARCAQMATWAPSRANSSATARPSPLQAAATMATRPLSPRSIPATSLKTLIVSRNARCVNDVVCGKRCVRFKCGGAPQRILFASRGVRN